MALKPLGEFSARTIQDAARERGVNDRFALNWAPAVVPSSATRKCLRGRMRSTKRRASPGRATEPRRVLSVLEAAPARPVAHRLADVHLGRRARANAIA